MSIINMLWETDKTEIKSTQGDTVNLLGIQ